MIAKMEDTIIKKKVKSANSAVKGVIMKEYLVIGILIVAIFSSFCLGNQMGKQTQAEAHRQ